MADDLAARPLDEPSLVRLALDHPQREQILAAHRVAVEAGDQGYDDPVTGYFVFTAAHLAAGLEAAASRDVDTVHTSCETHPGEALAAARFGHMAPRTIVEMAERVFR